jgi:putative ABC transport system permease protein
MLQIQNICKKYVTGDLVQTALDNVSLNLRDNEFVAILGPSGSGKTTMLNIIGGLDRYDSGDLIINGISTKKYKDRDWDSYRNHTIGFVFQSYNLIPHQSVLSNVELALTISGISRSERRRRAKEALEKVGLGNQLHKRPNQMSGGQMQRVAIARALVNNPDILLADEPTGALDSETSVQVMELLKEVAKDRLVVMVTHNPELANEYATRIVRVKDGHIVDDTDPYEIEQKLEEPQHKNMGKASMSILTALSLSFNNLRTKKGRTFLTAFAGSIGIIGIALILSFSNGVNTYITDIQKSTMTSYPISIEAQTIDLTSIMQKGQSSMKDSDVTHELDGVYSNGTDIEMASSITTSFTKNNLTEFKKYLDNPDSEIRKHIRENGIVYSYNTKFDVFTYDSEGTFVNTDGSTLKSSSQTSATNMMADMSNDNGMTMMTGSTGKTNNFTELLPGSDSASVSQAVTDAYDVLYGNWPSSYDEAVLVMNKNNEISSAVLYQLGILPTSEYKEIMKRIDAGEEVTMDTEKISYEDICNKEYYLLPASDMYVKDDNGNYKSIVSDNASLKDKAADGIKLKISGIVRQNDDNDNALINKAVGYTKALTDYLMDYADKSEVVKAQRENKDINITNGMAFSPADDAAKIADARTYLTNLGVSDKASMFKNMMQMVYADNQQMYTQLMAMGEAQQAAMLDSYLENPDDSTLLSIYNSYISTGNYDDNMDSFGVISEDAPSAINIYVDSFEAKDAVSDCIKKYNEGASEDDKISYTDYVGLLMNSVTTIINVITYVLIAFVAVSLIVSSIMIGIITYISVLERTKEIGILRAIGASKRNISQVFNAETFIIGFCSGIIGIAITLLLLIPCNSIIHAVTDSTAVNAALPPVSAVVLIILSMVLTFIGGLIPAKNAAKKDPVTALRTE